MLMMLALSLSAVQAAHAKASIANWCAVNAPADQRRCVGEQTRALARFRTIATYYDDFGPARASDADTCLRSSAHQPSLDWTAAATCLSNLQTLHRQPQEVRTTPPPSAAPGWVPVARR